MRASIQLDFEDFDALRRLINQYSGIWLGDSKVVFMQVRLGERMRALNITSPREYYHLLKYDPQGHAEMQQLMDVISVNQTWFFRESEPLATWCDAILPSLMQRESPMRIWSAGCSTGEEPYTLAMMLLSAYPPLLAHQLEIFATDISRRALEVAKAGVYDLYTLRHTAEHWQAEYFESRPDRRLVVKERVRRLVHFNYANLVEPNLHVRLRAVDAVLCRNVFIYFDVHGRQRALENLYTVLKPGGYLILGRSESLAYTMTASPFEVARLGKVVLYRKKA